MISSTLLAVPLGTQERHKETRQAPLEKDPVFVGRLRRRAEDEKVVRSTREEFGGRGVPYHFLLGKYCKELYGLELGLRQMQRGERAILKILPEYLYDHPKCTRLFRSPPHENTAAKVVERGLAVVGSLSYRVAEAG